VATGDRLSIPYFFLDEASSLYTTRSFRFADGTSWDVAAIKARMFSFTQNADTLVGYASADVFRGGDGDDHLIGLGGNDQLSGDAGNDVLEGRDGNDTLAGGTGDDTLDGGLGDDVYRIGLGDGADRLTDDGGNDRLELGSGIAAGNVRARWIDAGWGIKEFLLLLGDGTTLNLGALPATQGAAGIPIERLVFADGTSWNQVQILAALAPNLSLTGGVGDDLLRGGDGNDMYGRPRLVKRSLGGGMKEKIAAMYPDFDVRQAA
jgi:Ca2+-binding RTX toxin-like protein